MSEDKDEGKRITSQARPMSDYKKSNSTMTSTKSKATRLFYFD
jgi:hypothetical protein